MQLSKALVCVCMFLKQLPNNYLMRTFPTVHRIPSQGYILYKQIKKLRPELVGQPATKIAEMHRKNVPIHDVITTPELAYTGNNTFVCKISSASSPYLLTNGKLLINTPFDSLSIAEALLLQFALFAEMKIIV